MISKVDINYELAYIKCNNNWLRNNINSRFKRKRSNYLWIIREDVNLWVDQNVGRSCESIARYWFCCCAFFVFNEQERSAYDENNAIAKIMENWQRWIELFCLFIFSVFVISANLELATCFTK